MVQVTKDTNKVPIAVYVQMNYRDSNLSHPYSSKIISFSVIMHTITRDTGLNP